MNKRHLSYRVNPAEDNLYGMSDKIPELHVQLTKRTDGSVVLRCVRRDGSTTWQRHERHSTFFSFHDLSHFAVESTMGLRNGF